MDVASDRVNQVHVLKLLLLKDMHERNALRELSLKEAERHTATFAVQNAFQELAVAQQHRARVEATLYGELMSLETLTSAALDRHHLGIERISAEVASRCHVLDDARIAHEEAEAAASEMRELWVKRSTATHKWKLIEEDVRRCADIHAEAAGEIEADDEVSLRYGRVSLAQLLRD
ncbi:MULTISPECIES: hypothetical protein [Microvirga]|uniref:Type III secretion protein YscO n=1 Tax=Microvirga lotononidis TaxID=864069 RepID=I4Z462_9HYPH|nr:MULTISPECIES: hypothetical protein [Microvirga]EIM31004.1 hypothetical protein MicloDRAFT_00002850 [Microvirga lotononidis]WQO30181.1 hypothetical protein U0023_28050 [Microvirga lotononidis]